jgi:hypothetical protein
LLHLDVVSGYLLPPDLALGSDPAKPRLFQGLFARERCYLALEAHFPYRNGRHKAGTGSRRVQTVHHGKLAMLCSEVQFIFHLLNKSLAADRDWLKPAIVSSRYVCARFYFHPFTNGGATQAGYEWRLVCGIASLP